MLKVVLDIDELLIHTYKVTVLSKLTQIKQVVVKKKVPKKQILNQFGRSVSYSEGNNYWTAFYVQRPDLKEFFIKLSELNVLLIFWTASKKEYADAILNQILPETLQKCQRLYRKNCSTSITSTGGHKYKDLSVMFNPSQLKKTVLFDDSIFNTKCAINNTILSPKWEGNLEMEVEPSFFSLVLDGIELMKTVDDVSEVTKEIEKEIWKAYKIKRDSQSNNQRQSIARIGSKRFNNFASGMLKSVKSLH